MTTKGLKFSAETRTKMSETFRGETGKTPIVVFMRELSTLTYGAESDV